MKKLTLLLLPALALRLWLMPMAGHLYDLQLFREWVAAGLSHSPLAIYAVSSANYPPLALWPLLAMGWLYQFWGDVDNQAFNSWLKLPAVLADLLTVILIFQTVRPMRGERPALFWASCYAFNPAVCYVSAWWGQLEALYTLPMVLMVAALARSRPGQALIWFTVAMLVKPHAVIVAPLLLGPLWQGQQPLVHRLRAILGGMVGSGLVLGLVLGPLAWVGQLSMLLAKIEASAGRQLFPTLNAHNLWYALTLGQGSFAMRAGQPIYDNQPIFGPLTIWQLGLLLLAVWVGWMVALSWRKAPPSPFWLAASLTFGYFMLPAESHERYLFPTLALLTVCAAVSRPGQLLLLSLSLTFFLNLFWVAPAFPLPGFSENITWGLIITTLNLLALAYLGNHSFLEKDLTF